MLWVDGKTEQDTLVTGEDPPDAPDDGKVGTYGVGQGIGVIGSGGQVTVSGGGSTAWGTPVNGGLGAAGGGCVFAGGALIIALTDGNGEVMSTPAIGGVEIGEGGVTINGKVTIPGRLDPLTVEFTDDPDDNIPDGGAGFAFDSTFGDGYRPLWKRPDTHAYEEVAFVSDVGGGVGAIAVDVGLIATWHSSTPPTGWLLCDGSAVSRATYADLFDVIGTTFGAGDGTTFNLPNFTGRSPMGVNAAGTGQIPTAAGAATGEQTHTMTSAELVAHIHGINGKGTTATVGGTFRAPAVGPDAGTFGSTESTGSGTPFNVVHPVLGVYFIIRYEATTAAPSASTFADNLFRIFDDGDSTKEVAFQVSGVSTGTTRTLTVPDASGTIALTSDLASYQPLDATLTALAGLTTAADQLIYATGADALAMATLTAFGRSLLDDANAAAGLTTLGVSAYAQTLLDDADAATARATLGLVIGTNVQAQDAELAAIAGLASAADRLPYFTGSGTASLATFTAFGRSLVDDADAAAGLATLGVSAFAQTLLDDADAAAALTTLGVSAFAQTLLDDADAATTRATLGLTIGTHVQAYDAELAALAGLASAADKLPYFTGAGTAALADFTAFGRSLVDDADAATARTTLGAQAQDALLQDIADLAPTAGEDGYSLVWDDGAGALVLADVAGSGGGGPPTAGTWGASTQTGNTTLTATSDFYQRFVPTADCYCAMPVEGSTTQWFYIVNDDPTGRYNVTVREFGGSYICVRLAAGEGCFAFCDGTAWRFVRGDLTALEDTGYLVWSFGGDPTSAGQLLTLHGLSSTGGTSASVATRLNLPVAGVVDWITGQAQNNGNETWDLNVGGVSQASLVLSGLAGSGPYKFTEQLNVAFDAGDVLTIDRNTQTSDLGDVKLSVFARCETADRGFAIPFCGSLGASGVPIAWGPATTNGDGSPSFDSEAVLPEACTDALLAIEGSTAGVGTDVDILTNGVVTQTFTNIGGSSTVLTAGGDSYAQGDGLAVDTYDTVTGVTQAHVVMREKQRVLVSFIGDGNSADDYLFCNYGDTGATVAGTTETQDHGFVCPYRLEGVAYSFSASAATNNAASFRVNGVVDQTITPGAAQEAGYLAAGLDLNSGDVLTVTNDSASATWMRYVLSFLVRAEQE
jgi:microcystin-dependent protein